MDKLLESLSYIGLSEKESLTYLALLRLGEATVQEIAYESGIKRPNTYLILDDLRQKGLVIKLPNAKKAIYSAKTPDELYEKTLERMRDFQRSLPALRSISPSDKTIKTLCFDGVNGIEEAMKYRIHDLQGSVDEGFFAKNDGSISKNVLEVFDRWNTHRERYGIFIGGVTPDHPSTRSYTERFPKLCKDVVFAPLSSYDSDVSIELTKEFIRIVDAHDLKAIIIENSRISDALSQIFKLAKEKIRSDVSSSAG